MVTVADVRERLRDRPVDLEVGQHRADLVREARFRGPGGSRADALLVEPNGEATAAALLVHPASGDRTSLLPDALDLAAHGVRCLLPQLAPERVHDAEAGVASRVGWIETLCLGLAALRACSPDGVPVGYVGQNLGGTLAGAVAAVDGGLVAAVTAAALPDMGEFFASSPHPVAEDRRTRHGLATVLVVREGTAALELVATAGAAPGTRWFLQLGGRDDWLPTDETVEAYRRRLPDAEIAVYPTAGHGLAIPEARTDRVGWLRRHLAASATARSSS
ncbi:hypothetical protein [Actinomycetospora sp. TBRC 11914]|uniref:hypothetical protein n=1 Tax=Actinomycetospora sp. TBRC 11914 TaxID=2729387 RepID=UPI00145D4F08|nr:hypothetical protein [Actinomycetospora sp. TBRC 11914]NMO91718.1 hypothetical protein [Actinomycetospora sp. TBRC 11914]